MNQKCKILVVDDQKEMRDFLKKVLSRKGNFKIDTTDTCKSAIKKSKEIFYEIVLTDLMLTDGDGMYILKEIKKYSPETLVIMMTAFGSIDSAVDAMREGAYDYISKPFKVEEISIILDKALEKSLLSKEIILLREEIQKKYEFSNIIGKSKIMQDIFYLIKRIADSKSSVLITGKSGTGKELVAKAIHFNSSRRNNPFIPVNCSAIPETLLESELFGHIKGAFTGAISNKKGLFDEADNGTIFLDEIADIPLTIQVKLLRFLQERIIKPVGSNKFHKVDLRVIAATNRNLKELVNTGRFRDDLYYRLNVIPINLPDLTERSEDIPLLVNSFLSKSTLENKKTLSISKESMNILLNFSWPGNIRELENIIERAVILCRGDEITPDDLPDYLKTNLLDSKLSGDFTLQELEKEYIKKIFQKTSSHRIQTAKILGIDRRTLYRKLREYNLISERE
ncbi:sigma-54 dependent transcriptional regulator [bacterium]|nr:sigma-54 dependent transcriptional regulator [bacterium]